MLDCRSNPLEMVEFNTKILTLNVNGLNNPVKRQKIMTKLKKDKSQIIFLQETHLSSLESEKLKRFGYTNSFYSSYRHGCRRGVIILISNSVKFECIKKISDKEGRFIFVKGKLENEMVTLVNVYAPPNSAKQFFKTLFDIMILEMDGVLICGGDFNIVMNSKLDTTNKKKHTNPVTRMVKRTLKEFGIVDIWRELHSSKRDYTHYSPPNNSYARIDYFFMNKNDLNRVKKCEIQQADVSDHCAVLLTVNLKVQEKNTLWRLNVGMLNNKLCVEELKKDIITYQNENDNGEVTPVILWDALKAVIRGKLVAKTAAIKKNREEVYKKEKEKLFITEQQHKTTQDPTLLPKIKEFRDNIDKILITEIEKKTRYLKQSYYEVGPRAAKLLSKQLKKQQADRTIHKIRDTNTNQIIHDPKEIGTQFMHYYRDLYSQPPSANIDQINVFLEKLDLPSIGKNQNDHLTSPITKAEIKKAINKLKTNKSPGSDGLSSEWYKTFNEQLIPLLEKSFNYTLEHGEMPPSWNEAVISVIPKKKNSETCSDYRPISLLNVDYKLYTSIIAKRYEYFISDIIDEDQTGFIKGRQAQDNTRRTLYIINHILKKGKCAALISLDAEKAFDSVNWTFLFQVLEKFGLNDKAVRCIKTLYQNPTARIRINGSLTESINLGRSTRQGCCLSPTLFAIFIEPLAQAIRQNSNLKGIEVGEEEHIIGLFADDVVCFLEEPDICIPVLIDQLETFGFYSGYKLNLTKTQILPFNYLPSKFIQQKYQLNWRATKMKYLGVTLTQNTEDLYEHNYVKLDKEIKSDFDRWALLPLDIGSRIETIKMSVLPRLLYLFQSLPIEIPEKQFRLWDKIMSRFIWNGRRPRIKFETLQIKKDKGGLALPYLKGYFHAAQIRHVICWCDKDYIAKWKNLEKSVQGREIQSLIGDREEAMSVIKQLNTVTQFTLKTWFNLVRKYKLEKELGLLRWIAYDKDFIPGSLDQRFKQWIPNGLTAICTLIKNGNFMSFQEIKQKYDLSNQDHFRYLQIRDFFNKKIKRSVNLDKNPTIKSITETYNAKKFRIISTIYGHIMEARGNTTMYVKLKWQRELGVNISDDEWSYIWKTQQSTTSSRVWRLHCWKNLIRFFITPKIRNKHTSLPQPCWRSCGDVNTNHSHVFWLCPKIAKFWEDVHSVIGKVLGYAVPKSCTLLYLGVITGNVLKEDRYILKIMLAACKKAITRKWYKIDPPLQDDWMTVMDKLHIMEQLTYRIRIQEDQYCQKWEKWTEYIKSTEQRPSY